jgi:pimeloyl-ACP methyl ester carboxylesterase
VVVERVPVAGGDYTVARWPGEGATLLAVHGITASHLAWVPVVDRLTSRATVLAPDLRGRGGSASLPGPFGMAAHVADLIATLDHLGIREVVLVGHSLGAYVGIEFARTAPGRTRGLVLVDGGLSLPVPPGIDPEQVLRAVLGPALARLEMLFPSREAYREFWREHPAFRSPGSWSPAVERYIDYDLVGEAPMFHSRVDPEAVRVDGRAPLAPEASTRVEGVACPMLLLTAPRGLLDQPEPLLPRALIDRTLARVPHLAWREIPDTNHYTIVLGSGGPQVAAEIDGFVAALGG